MHFLLSRREVYSMRYQELLDQQSRIAGQMRMMYDAAEREDRGFNDTEKSLWEKLLQEAEATEERLSKLPVNDFGGAIPYFPGISDARGSLSAPYAKNLYDVKTGEKIRSWDRSTAIEVMKDGLDPEQVEICRDLSFGHFLRAIQFGPRNGAEERALSIGTPSAGGYTVPAPLMVEFIDSLRNTAVVLAAGGVIVPMTSKTLDIARLDSDPAPSWRNEAATVSQSDAVFSQVKLDAQDLSVEIVTSRELAQDSANLEAILKRSFVQAFAVELDRVALVGSGTTPEPEGVLNATGVTEIDLSGATMTRYQSLVALRRDVQKANAIPNAWVMNHTTRSELAGLEASDNQPLQPPEYVSELEMFATEGVPDNLGVGTDESPVFVGNWSDLLLGIREDTTIQLNPFLRADTGQVSWFIHLRADVQLARPASFGRIIGNTGVV
jgi:HK97 family phage major capsid protein